VVKRSKKKTSCPACEIWKQSTVIEGKKKRGKRGGVMGSVHHETDGPPTKESSFMKGKKHNGHHGKRSQGRGAKRPGGVGDKSEKKRLISMETHFQKKKSAGRTSERQERKDQIGIGRRKGGIQNATGAKS